MFPLARFRVDDDSMRPTLEPGDYVVVNRWAYRLRAPRKGELVVLRDPDDADRWLVKRVSDTIGSDRVMVLGDNADRSRDSRAFGPIVPEEIIGRVWLRLKP